jgi:5-methylcytosine-specific restriction protein A
MSRSVPEWIGKTADDGIPGRVMLRMFDRCGGICQCGCNRKIRAGEGWVADHIVALINGGQHRESNLQPLLTEHHKIKTRSDVAIKSKVARIRAKHLGISKPRSRWGYGKAEVFKKKISGEVVRR